MAKKINSIRDAKTKNFWFALGMIIVPFLWWVWTFFYTTTDSIILAFKDYNLETGLYEFCGFENFKVTIGEMFTDGIMSISLKNSVLLWLSQVVFAIPVAIVISFALYKRMYFHGFYKVILFLPQIVSSTVWVVAFKYIIEIGLELPELLDFTLPTTKYTLWIYMLWLGLAGNMVIYTGAMSRVPPSLVEAGHLDGMTDVQELWHIVLPLIYPTLTVVLLTCIVSIFTIQFPAFTFFGLKNLTDGGMDYIYTFGTYTFVKGLSDNVDVPKISALSIIVCLIAAPVALGLKSLLTRLGPNVEY